MSRIIPLEAPYDNAVADTFKRFLPPGMPPLALFRTQAHNPRVLQRMFAGNLLDEGSISLRARELIILRTCFRCGSEYEWGVHVALFSQQATLSAAEVALTLRDDHGQAGLPAHEAILLAAVDELHDTSTISDALWQQLTEHYRPAQIIELIALVGNYHAISFITNAARIDLEAFAPRFGAAHR
jgi:alkylhydroperoxidase family enzyme